MLRRTYKGTQYDRHRFIPISAVVFDFDFNSGIQDEKPDERPEILPAEPTGRRPTSEHVRTSYDSDPSSQNEASTSAVVQAPQRRDSRNPNNRLSIGRMQKKLDRMFKKQSLKATNKSLTKSKSQEELESRHNNWRRTALISSLCSVVCVLPSFVYFVVKSTSFFKREYYDHEWVSVCFGYVSFSSFYMILAPINFFINPFVYYFTNREFRKKFRSTFKCLFIRRYRRGSGFTTADHSIASSAMELPDIHRQSIRSTPSFNRNRATVSEL